MIGALLAARFIGRKPWILSIIFWVVLMCLGYLSSLFLMSAMSILIAPFVIIILNAILFLALAVYYLRVPLLIAIVMYFASFFINLIVTFFLMMMGIGLMLW